MPNIAELERVLTYITDHPEEHKQNRWTCATGACLAGHAALMNGYSKYRNMDMEIANGTVVDSNGDGNMYDVQTIALKIFDLDRDQGLILFGATNTRDKLALMIKDIANGEDLCNTWHVINPEDRDEIWERKGRKG